ncbi:hypothetical protein SB6419_00214 [Klebsiella spallanzanii]|nr:hypothetical protein SB6419_00214 [Klebsiella spallanzanii]
MLLHTILTLKLVILFYIKHQYLTHIKTQLNIIKVNNQKDSLLIKLYFSPTLNSEYKQTMLLCQGMVFSFMFLIRS